VTIRTFVIGVGMTPFVKPGSRDWQYPDMAREAGKSALADAGIGYERVQQAYVGSALGGSGHRALYELGVTGVSIMTVVNACASGSSALFLARQAVRGGTAECALALGFEKMERGSLSTGDGAVNPLQHQLDLAAAARAWDDGLAPMPQMFGNAGREHMDRYGSKPEHFAWIGWKNHKHSVHNPNSQFRDEYTEAEILAAPLVYEPLTRLQCSPTSDGAACAIVASERFVDENDLWDRAVELVGHAVASDPAATFEGAASAIRSVGSEATRLAARRALDQATTGIDEVDVIELHDCFSTNELLSYEALGLAEEGHGHELVDAADTTYGGRWVVNPSGGLISKGHPIGATGVAQCAELTWQLRGTAGRRQVPGARIGLQHNVGLANAAVVAVYRSVS
jgi:acetyl-CoA acetyltransferase